MSFTYTPSPVALVDLTLPQDVVDNVVVGTVNPPMQALADGIAQAQLIRSQSARYNLITGTVYNSGATRWGLAQFFAGPGITLSGGNTITVDEGGKYFVSVTVLLEAPLAFGDNVLTGALVESTGPSVFSVYGLRATTDNSVQFPATGSALWDATAGYDLYMRLITGGAAVSVIGGSLSIFRIA